MKEKLGPIKKERSKTVHSIQTSKSVKFILIETNYVRHRWPKKTRKKIKFTVKFQKHSFTHFYVTSSLDSLIIYLFIKICYIKVPAVKQIISD